MVHHELGRLTGLRVEQVIHTESGEGKGPVDMKLGLLSMSFQKTLARLHRRCAEEMFQHMEIAVQKSDCARRTEIRFLHPLGYQIRIT